MKKNKVLSVLTLTSIAAFSMTPYASAADSAAGLDLNSLDSLVSDTATTTTNTWNTAPVTETAPTSAATEKISEINIVFEAGTTLEANASTKILAKVSAWTTELDDTKVSLVATVSNTDGWVVWTATYNKDTKLFEIPYTAPNNGANVSIVFKATGMTDTTNTFEKTENITINAPKATSDNATTTTTSEEQPIINTTSTNTASTTEEVKVIENKEVKEDVKLEANVLSTKLIWDNRIVVSFDRELFLPEEPLKLVSITKASDNTTVKVNNVTLGEDKKSLVILTDKLEGKVEYKVAINEVVDGETKKKISVVNGNLTVTGLNEVAIIIIASLLTLWVIANRRKKA